MSVTIEQHRYGVTADGQSVDRYRFSNESATTVDIITFGGILTSWCCADRDGRIDDIVLGYDTLGDYEACEIYMGCIAGRYANRIARGRFELDGHSYTLEQNNNGHHLHGGSQGFHKIVWGARVEPSPAPVLVLSHRSKAGSGGYPGELEVQVRYSLSEDNTLSIDYRATADAPTVLSLTSHGYFNLHGHRNAGKDGVLDHSLWLGAEQVLQTDAEGIPTGNPLPVADTGFDFTTALSIAQQISRLNAVRGLDSFDHCYVLNRQDPAAILYNEASGRCMEVSTTMPGLQVYSSGFVSGCVGKQGVVYDRRGSMCLEAQYFPDSPNQPGFPSTTLRPGEVWQERTAYCVSIRD